MSKKPLSFTATLCHVPLPYLYVVRNEVNPHYVWSSPSLDFFQQVIKEAVLIRKNEVLYRQCCWLGGIELAAFFIVRLAQGILSLAMYSMTSLAMNMVCYAGRCDCKLQFKVQDLFGVRFSSFVLRCRTFEDESPVLCTTVFSFGLQDIGSVLMS